MAQVQNSAKPRGGQKGPAASKGKKAPALGKKVDDEREESLQAVILADSFETRFNPFTLETPRVSLRACSVPYLCLSRFDMVALSHISQARDLPPITTSGKGSIVEQRMWTRLTLQSVFSH